MALEETELYSLISRGTRQSLQQAWRLIATLSEEDIKKRSEETRATYLHLVVSMATDVYKRYSEITPLIPLIYRLALSGINVNAQNHHGNTSLHLACLRPNAEALCPHLIRIGADPCIQNKKQCRIIHTYKKHQCHVVKGQSSVKSGIWNAVEKEDAALVEKLLRSWCRVNIRKNKSLLSVAEETANLTIMRLLQRFEQTNELVSAAFACDLPLVKSILKAGKADLSQRDEACDVPCPLVVALEALGEQAEGVIRVLREAGTNENVKTHREAFEDSVFYTLVEAGTDASLREVLELLAQGKVDVTLRSQREESEGWTYLHYIVDRYHRLSETHEERARLLLRMVYRLAMLGIDVHARDSKGDTALVKSSAKRNQNLITHIIRIGGDPSLVDAQGRAVNEEVYEDKGKMVFDRKYRVADLPGLWVAVENNDLSKAERWVKSWCRVNTKKGDRRLLDVSRALKRTKITKLLEEYEHINEFVCATFAGDLKRMMDILALGKGKNKVNTIDDFFHVGFTWDRHAEFMARPIIVSAVELCEPSVVDFLLNFGADLSKQHAESAPCGPAAFWAFRDHVNSENALVVAKHADVNLRDEEGATMLHRAIKKKRPEGKVEIVETLLERGINVAARDFEGSTARDYITMFDVEGGESLRQIIDNHVLEMVNTDQHYSLESLLLESYDHIMDIRGTKRNKTALEIAELKEFKEIIHLLHEFADYRCEVELLHESARKGDVMTISKLSGEKRCAWSKDKAGRSLLHNAVLHEHPDVVKFLVEQYPNLINVTDNFNRTPLHLCVCLKERHHIWPILQDGGADQNLVDVNNMSVYDYVRELDLPTATKDKPRGRRRRDYRPSKVIEEEIGKVYGKKAESYELQRLLMAAIKTDTLKEIKQLTNNIKGDLSIDDLDLPLLCCGVELKRQEIVKHLLTDCGARAHVTIQMPDSKGELHDTSLRSAAKKAGLRELYDFIKTIPKPEDLLEQEDTGVDQVDGEATRSEWDEDQTDGGSVHNEDQQIEE